MRLDGIVVISRLESPPETAFDALDGRVVEGDRDVLAEQVVAIVPRRLEDRLVDADEAAAGIELIGAVADRVDERSNPASASASSTWPQTESSPDRARSLIDTVVVGDRDKDPCR
nr:hypothetical protein [Natrarchaeobius chitinivorans]